MFCEATVTTHWPLTTAPNVYLISSPLSSSEPKLSKFKKVPQGILMSQSWDVYKNDMDAQPENITPPATDGAGIDA